MARRRRALIALDDTTIRHWTNLTTGRQEIRSARSADGDWTFTHHDDSGTTWTAFHHPTRRFLDYLPTLEECRAGAADGFLLRALDLQDARRAAEAARRRCQYLSPWTGQRTCTLHDPEPGEDYCRQHLTSVPV